jgi:prophage tail gpP-like protein
MPERVAITLEDGSRFGDWSEVEIARGIDSFSAVSLSGPFDHARREVRAALQPLAFPRVAVTIADELVFTGRVKDIVPNVDAGSSSVGVTAYSIAADLAEVCTAPEFLPLEFNGLNLRQIDYKMAGPAIGEVSIFEGPPGAKFARVRCEPDATIHSFLVDLALQRGFVLSDAPNGALLYRSETRPGLPVARLEGQPLARVTASFQPSSWFGRLTGRASKKPGRGGAAFSMYNQLYRPFHPRDFTMRLSDTESSDVPKAVKAAIGRMVAQVVTYQIDELPTWRDPSGRLWTPNTTLSVLAPGAMIYRESELLIRQVTLRQTPDGETASLACVLPGTFGGTNLPKVLPWDL